jgi:hypothetical protein
MLPAPSISGLFKRRQFEPEVILLAVASYLRFSLFVPRRAGTAGGAGRARQSRHGVAMDPALLPLSDSRDAGPSSGCS